MKPASQTMMTRQRSSDTLRPRFPALRHAGSFGRCSGSICVAWLLLAVCILVLSGGTSALPAIAVEGHETTAVDLGVLLDAGDGDIVTLAAGNTRLAVHRAVLAARSQVFAAMFSHDPLEESRREYVVLDVEGTDLRKLVTFMYSGRTPQLPGMTSQLLEAAKKYGVSGLRDAFEQQLARQLTVDNAAAKAVLAVTHNYSTLRQAAVDFIRDHGFQVMATQGWAEAVHSYPGAVAEFTRMLVDSPTATSTPATAGCEAASTTQPHSDDDRTSTAAKTSSACPDAPLDEAAVSSLRGLSRQEKGRRLLQAAYQGSVKEVRALLAAGADVGARDDLQWTALHYAAKQSHVEAVRCLLQAGAEVDARDGDQWTPLHQAAQHGEAAVARLLLASSADPNARTHSDRTPLHWAARNGHTAAATALLEAGADRGARDEDGKTPLDLASWKNHKQLTQLLERY